MSSRVIRSHLNALPYDDFEVSAKMVNFGAISDIGKFNNIVANADNDSLNYVHNSYISDGQGMLNVNFTGVFTVSFWAKFPATVRGLSELTNIRFMIVLNDGTVINHNITNPDNLWHHYSVVRSADGLTTMRIDGETVETPIITSAALNLENDSYIYLGDIYRYYDGCNVIVDDLCIVDGVVWTQDFDTELPDDYLDLSKFRHYLYVIVSTGEVYGYAE